MSRFNAPRSFGVDGNPPLALKPAWQRPTGPPAPFHDFRGSSPAPRAGWNAGLAAASFLLFVVVSRLPEVMANTLGSSLKIALLMSLVTGAFCIASGNFPQTLRKGASMAMLVFTGWWIVCVPFSVWPGGSVALLRDQWLFSMVAFFLISTMPVSSAGLSVYGSAMAWSAVFVNLALMRYGVTKDSRGSMEFTSSLSNPNIAALQLLLGLPFLIYWTRTRGFFSARGVLGFFSSGLLAFLIVTRTGSRSGLLILAILCLMLLSDTKIFVKIALLLALVIGTAAVIPFIPSYLVYRYGTLLSSDADDTSEAALSSRERHEVLRQSFLLTFQHPVFGVGAGQFQVAAAAISKDEGVRAIWLETHNMYTQISSETGLPGVFFYMTMIFLSLFPVWKDLRSARRARSLLPRHEFARALLISATGLLINSAFTSVAYHYYWPIVCSMGVAYQRVVAIENPAAQGAPMPIGARLA